MLLGPATRVMLASLQLAAARSVAPIEGSDLRSCVAMHTVGEMRIHLAVAVVLLMLPAAAVELRWPEATLRGFPVLRDTNGRPVGDGSVSQWIEHGALHVKAVHDFRDGRRVEEQAVLRQQPELEQLRWSFIEQRGNEVLRRFEADLVGRSATAQKKEENGELKHWEESLEIEPGKTFAGVGFMYAVKNLGDRLDRGEKVQLRAVAFTPQPRTVTVTVMHEGVETLRFGSRRFQADRIAIHPEIPAIARPFVKAPDQHLWFYRAFPPTLLRAEIALAEPSDPIIRIDALPAASSAEAHAPPPGARRARGVHPARDQQK
jgi:hypothetical protein